MKVYEFLAEGFEEVEALTPLDMLRRAGADIRLVSVSGASEVTGAHGVRVGADLPLSAVSGLPDLVILPGGMPGAQNLRDSEEVCRIVTETARQGGFVAAICAAPFIPGELGLLEGKTATCYPGFEPRLKGAILSSETVVRDGRIITAAGMGAALPFAEMLVSALFGSEKAEELMRAIVAGARR